MIMQQWHAATTTRHSYTLTYQFLIAWSPDVWLDLELLWDIQFGLPAILNNSLASYQSVVTIITCYECIYVTGSGHGNPKIFGCTSCASGWTPLSKFLDLPLHWSCAVHDFAEFMLHSLASYVLWMALPNITWVSICLPQPQPFEFDLSEMVNFELCFTEFEVHWHESIASNLDQC